MARRTKNRDSEELADFDSGSPQLDTEAEAPSVQAEVPPTPPATLVVKEDTKEAEVSHIPAAALRPIFNTQSEHARNVRIRLLARQHPEIRALIAERDALRVKLAG